MTTHTHTHTSHTPYTNTPTHLPPPHPPTYPPQTPNTHTQTHTNVHTNTPTHLPSPHFPKWGKVNTEKISQQNQYHNMITPWVESILQSVWQRFIIRMCRLIIGKTTKLESRQKLENKQKKWNWRMWTWRSSQKFWKKIHLNRKYREWKEG